MAKTETADQAEKTLEERSEEIESNIERVHSLVLAENTEAAQELYSATDVMISSLRGATGRETTALRKKYRDALKEAAKAERGPEPKPEPSKEVATVTPYEEIPGVAALIRQGADAVRKGFSAMASSSDSADEVAGFVLGARIRLINPKTGLPDLIADTHEAKRANSDMYKAIEESLKGNPDAEAAFRIYRRQVQRRTQHKTVEYVRALKNSPEEAAAHFALALERNPELDATAAVQKECKVPEQSAIEKDREAKRRKAELAQAKAALAGGESDMPAEEAQAIVDAATVAPIDKAISELDKAEKAALSVVKAVSQLEDADRDKLAARYEALLNALKVAKVDANL